MIFSKTVRLHYYNFISFSLSSFPVISIKPVQRIMRYQLLLKDILKYTEKAEEDSTNMTAVVEVMQKIPKSANEMMMVGRLQVSDYLWDLVILIPRLDQFRFYLIIDVYPLISFHP